MTKTKTNPVVDHAQFGDVTVSTFRTFDDPETYDTAIWGGEHDGYQEITHTIDEARSAHAKAFALALTPSQPAELPTRSRQ